MAKKVTSEIIGLQNVADPIKEILPLGNQVLVERLNEGELFQTSLLIKDNDKPSNQAYIVAIGPTVNAEHGLVVGDRVLLQGSYVPVPPFKANSKREMNLVYPDMIKAKIVD